MSREMVKIRWNLLLQLLRKLNDHTITINTKTDNETPQLLPQSE